MFKLLSALIVLCWSAAAFTTVNIDLNNSTVVRKLKFDDELHNFGYDVRSAGDFNRDGIPDVVVSGFAPNTLGEGIVRIVYVVFGGAHVDTLDLATFKTGQTTGFKITSSGPVVHNGQIVNAAGDFNGDGFADIVVRHEQNVAVIYGFNTSTTIVTDLDLSVFDSGSIGFLIYPPTTLRTTNKDLSDLTLTAAGDVNADGMDDLLLCYTTATLQAATPTGVCYVIFGVYQTRPALPLDSFLVDASLGYRVIGATSMDKLGSVATGNFDFNDDGISDFALTGATTTYVVFGQRRDYKYTELDLSKNVDVSVVLRIEHSAYQHANGVCALTSLTDANHDGVSDLALSCATTTTLITTTNSTITHNNAHRDSVTVIFGRVECNPFQKHLDLNHFASGVDGYRIFGPEGLARFGSFVTNGGDLNGDGLSEIVVGGASDIDGKKENVVYVVYSVPPIYDSVDGSKTTTTATTTSSLFTDIDLSLPNEEVRKVVRMTVSNPNTRSGLHSVSNLGDYNKDGYSDFAFVDEFDDQPQAGVVYVMSAKHL